MADLTKELMRELITEIHTLLQNEKGMNKLVDLLQDPDKKLNREKIDLALAKALSHSNKTNIKLIHLVSLIVNPPPKTESEKVMDNIRNKNKGGIDDIFSILGGGR